MKIDNSINKKNMFSFFFAIGIIVLMSPYFLWTTFSPFMSNLSNGVLILIVAYGGIYIIKNRRVKKQQIVLMILIFGYALYRIINSQNFSVLYHLKILFVVFQLLILVLMPENERVRVFYYFKKIFCVLLFWGLITYPFALLKIHIAGFGSALQSESTGWASGGFYYKNYLLAIYTANDNSLIGYVGRFCGVFNEPGVIGTFSALFLAADQYDLNKKDNIILLIGGLLSFSFAFYIMLGIYMFFFGGLWSLIMKAKNRGFIIISIIVVVIGILFLWNTNSTVQYILNELLISRLKKLVVGVDNRTSSYFDTAYELFKNSENLMKLLFGNGFGSTVLDERMASTSSYKTQIFDLGYFGLIYLYGICIYTIYKVNPSRNTKAKFVLISLFLISTYQRIGVLDVSYISILLCGGCYDEK